MIRALALSTALVAAVHAADPPAPAAAAPAEHGKNAEKLSGEQDELAANVKQIILEQTAQQVIQLFNDAKNAMNDSSDGLASHDTGGKTIAAQTDVIERILDAAKERQKQQGGKAGDAMLDMMQNMAGKDKDKGKDGKGKDGKGKQPGDKPGQGQTGDSNTANESVKGSLGGKEETRRVPKAAGNAGQPLPPEFHKALDAYNRGAEKLAK